jgi:hypothetical protein
MNYFIGFVYKNEQNTENFDVFNFEHTVLLLENATKKTMLDFVKSNLNSEVEDINSCTVVRLYNGEIVSLLGIKPENTHFLNDPLSHLR